MIKYKMLISGSVCDVNGKRYYCNKGQIIEAEKGSFDESYAEALPSPRGPKPKAERAQYKPNSEKAD